MDTRADFQRLLEDMDKVIYSKRQELSELDERLESARLRLSEKEAKELREAAEAGRLTESDGEAAGAGVGRPIDEYVQEQRRLYEQQLEQFGEELAELESINQELAKENGSLRKELSVTQAAFDKLQAKCHVMSESLDEVQGANLELNLRLARAESELQLQQKLLKKSHDQDELLMDAFNDKLESLKKAIEWRDEEIRRLRMDHRFTLESFGIEPLNNNDGSSYSGAELQSQAATTATAGGNGQLVEESNKQRVIEIAAAFREKDAQIELLKSQLLQATRDLEHNAHLMETLTRQQQQHPAQSTSSPDANGGGLRLKEPHLAGHSAADLANKLSQLEGELEAKDGQLHLAEFRNHHYETIVPNMIGDLIRQLATSGTSAEFATDRLARLEENLGRLLGELSSARVLFDEIEHLRRKHETKDAQIFQLVDELNQLHAKFSLVQQQCDLLQANKHLHLHQTTVRDEEDHVLDQQQQGERGSPSSSIEMARKQPPQATGAIDSPPRPSRGGQPQSPVSSVAAANLEHTSTVQATGYDQSSTGDATSAGQPTAGARDETTTTMTMSSNKQPAQQLKSPQQMDHSSGPSGESAVKSSLKLVQRSGVHLRATSPRTVSSGGDPSGAAFKTLQNRLWQLEGENELLELAMKEILLSIKWSDAQCSTILIDCPSLERLCQLIEARFAARSLFTAANGRSSEGNGNSDNLTLAGTTPGADLFQFIVLKSELDLLRGQNEQLRADIKARRRDDHGGPSDYHHHHHYRRSRTASSAPNGSSEAEVAAAAAEAECQTEPVVLEFLESQRRLESWIELRPVTGAAATQEEQQQDNDERAGVSSATRADGLGASACKNCVRLVKLTNHLFQSIVRVEMRVSLSDETYMSRLVGLHKLIQLLERDLSVRESLLRESRRECHLLAKQKLMIQSRLQLLEAQLSSSLHPTARNSCGSATAAEARLSGVQQHHQQVTTGTLPVARPNDARMTIVLLQSIIGCLQARLDYKDERLRQLETLICSGNNDNEDDDSGDPSPASVDRSASSSPSQKLIKVR